MICTWFSCCYCYPIFCFIKIQNGLTFLVQAYQGCPGKEAVKHVSVCYLLTILYGMCILGGICNKFSIHRLMHSLSTMFDSHQYIFEKLVSQNVNFYRISSVKF